jgi:choline/glycine/proline betaine transport protein
LTITLTQTGVYLIKNKINKTVFFASTIIILTMTIISSFWPNRAELIFKSLENYLLTQLSWVYILAVGAMLFFTFWLMLSRYGDIKLGPDHSVPDYSSLSWFSLLFSAGMGIGHMFFGVAEPLLHFSSPPMGEAFTNESAREAMKITFFHWGLHAWAIYATFAVIYAYFAFRKNLPLLPRSSLYPFIGEKIYGPIGNLVDTLAVVSTMFGVATSLGFGVTQVNAGLNYLFNLSVNPQIQVLLIIVITLLATLSVVLGLDNGIKKLSNLNMIIAVV